METPEAAQLREIRRFEALVAALEGQVEEAVVTENGIQGYKCIFRRYSST